MNIFTYGSLMFPAVWQRVVRGEYRSVPAMLPGHARYEVKNETYPGLIVKPESAVNGVLYFDVDDADLIALDVFEGSEYRRASVRVSVADDRTEVAETYLFIAKERLSDRDWDPQAFRMMTFIDAYCPDRKG